MVFVREDITAKFLPFENKPIETLFIELNFLKKKWLFSCSYNPNKSHILNHLRLRNSLDLYSAKYENMILIGNFNVSPEDWHMEAFCESFGLKNFIKVPTCHKNPQNPTCIDLILTNSPLSFQSSGIIETGFYPILISWFLQSWKQPLKGTLMQIRKSPFMFVFIQK